MVPVVLTGTRDCNNESAHGHRAAPATLRLHPTYRSCVKRRIGTPLQTLLASTTEATRQRCSVSLEEPGARVSVNTGPPLAGCLPTGRLDDGTLSTPPS